MVLRLTSHRARDFPRRFRRQEKLVPEARPRADRGPTGRVKTGLRCSGEADRKAGCQAGNGESARHTGNIMPAHACLSVFASEWIPPHLQRARAVRRKSPVAIAHRWLAPGVGRTGSALDGLQILLPRCKARRQEAGCPRPARRSVSSSGPRPVLAFGDSSSQRDRFRFGRR
jgi:hypothetical protein